MSSWQDKLDEIINRRKIGNSRIRINAEMEIRKNLNVLVKFLRKKNFTVDELRLYLENEVIEYLDSYEACDKKGHDIRNFNLDEDEFPCFLCDEKVGLDFVKGNDGNYRRRNK